MTGLGATANGATSASTVAGVPDPFGARPGEPCGWAWLQVIR